MTVKICPPMPICLPIGSTVSKSSVAVVEPSTTTREAWSTSSGAKTVPLAGRELDAWK
jgi:hypothetical protein